MAYDDAIARLCLTLEIGSLREQLSGAAVTRKYRSGAPFDRVALIRAREALEDLSRLPSFQAGALRFNRATLFSWLIFGVRLRRATRGKLDPETFDSFALLFAAMLEKRREARRTGGPLAEESWPTGSLLDVYDDRATARVLDVTSVLLRDAVIAVLFDRAVGWPGGSIEEYSLARAGRSDGRIGQGVLYDIIDIPEWGDLS
ncbi:hypothetical protein [Geodermatophilus amargosae]|uniref:hypothetical protein n=1 Tax=Geodermatophilus amargosae TaxID=1296565 RepID=UPI0034DF1FAB